MKLGDLRPHHVSDTLAAIKRRREKAIAEAQAHNELARAHAAEADKVRQAKGLKRPIKPQLVPVPRPFGNCTAQRVLATLRAALNEAVRAEEISRNVASQAPKPKYRGKKVRPWQPEQLGAWLDSVVDDPLYPLFHLGAFAGLRRGELSGLTRDDVDLDAGTVIVRWQITNVSYRNARKAIKQSRQRMIRRASARSRRKPSEPKTQVEHQGQQW